MYVFDSSLILFTKDTVIIDYTGCYWEEPRIESSFSVQRRYLGEKQVWKNSVQRIIKEQFQDSVYVSVFILLCQETVKKRIDKVGPIGEVAEDISVR